VCAQNWVAQCNPFKSMTGNGLGIIVRKDSFGAQRMSSGGGCHELVTSWVIGVHRQTNGGFGSSLMVRVVVVLMGCGTMKGT
jgi:hypothetical protein